MLEASGLKSQTTVKKTLQLIVSLAITTISFWWTFKDVRWPEMWASLQSANYVWLLPYLLILTGIHLCRTLRWGNLLSGIEKVPFRKLNEASGIGFMMLIVLPFRLGEFARPFLIAQRSSIRRSSAMTSVVLERIIDGIIIAVMLRGLLFFVPESDSLGHVRVGANIMFLVFFGGLVFLLLARWQHDRTVALIRGTFGRISPVLGEKVAYVVDGFVVALKQLPDGQNLTYFTLFTAGYWALNGIGMSVLAKAFDNGPTPLSLSLFQGFVVLAVLIIGLMVPAAPGSAGTFQAFVVLGLSLFLPKEVVTASGVAYANVLWVAQILQQIAFGVLLMFSSQQSFREIAGKLQPDEAAPPSLEAHRS